MNSVSKKRLAITLSVMIAFSCEAQLQKSDTVMYLWFQAGENIKIATAWKFGEPRDNQGITIKYAFTSISNLYDGYPLVFRSVRKIPSDTIKIEAVKSKTTVTVDEMSNFIKDNYPDGAFGGGPYFDGLKHIYILETTPCKGFITITKVRVDVHRGD